MHNCFLIFFVFVFLVSPSTQSPDIGRLSEYFESLLNETLGFEKIQNKVNEFNFTLTYQNGTEILNELAEHLSIFLNKHINIVKSLAKVARASLREKTFREKWNACCTYNESKLQENENFNTPVDFEGSCEIIAPLAPRDLLFLSRNLTEKMEENRRRNPELKWQYMANYQGVLTANPAFRSDECPFFDPRFRPWYVSTTQTVRRNVLILLDISRSMDEKFNSVSLIDIARNLTDVILKTLTASDRVTVIAFNNQTIRPDCCLSESMGLATSSTKNYINNEFLVKLQPLGESMYTIGFTAAFEMLKNTKMENNLSKDEYVIVFISDGKPKEKYHNISELYQTIAEGNLQINNKAKIFAFGVGQNVDMTILDTIARLSDRSNQTGGRSVRINDPEMLENTVATLDISNPSVEYKNNITFSAPYVDSGGLGLIFTVTQPLFYENETFYGMVAVDATVENLIHDNKLFNNSQHSYFFIIDKDGRVFTHPLFHQPRSFQEFPDFVIIDQLERDQDFKPIMRKMLLGERGSKTILKQKIVAIDNEVKTTWENATYFWKPISETGFIACVVLRQVPYVSVLNPDAIFPFLNPQIHSKFRYHRLDLDDESNPSQFCRHFHRKTTTTETFLYLSQTSFVDSFQSLEKETKEVVQKYTRFFRELLQSNSTQNLNSLIEKSKVSDVFAYGVISDVMWTSLVNELWLDQSFNQSDHLVQRFVGTRSGVFRLFPGSVLRGGYDPRTRIWYQLAAADPNKTVISKPYEDAGGFGTVITISKAILTPAANRNRAEVLGVMAIDFSLNHLYSKLLQLYPNCSNNDQSYGWFCLLVDETGKIVLHPDYSGGGQEELFIRHISEDSFLLSHLLEQNLAESKGCLDLEKNLFRSWFGLKNEINLTELLLKNSNPCSGFFMKKIEGTNVFFLARLNKPWCYDAYCPEPTNICSNVSTSTAKWLKNCPCSRRVNFNLCLNTFQIRENVVPCVPVRPYDGGFEECVPTQLPQCYSRFCSQATQRLECTTLVGCTWCSRTTSGVTLSQPYCSETEKCFNGIENNEDKGYENPICEIPEVEAFSNLALILGLSVTIPVLVIASCIFIFLCIRRRRRRRSRKDSEANSVTSQNGEDINSHELNPNQSQVQLKNQKTTKKQSEAPKMMLTAKVKGKVVFEKPIVLATDNDIPNIDPPLRRPLHPAAKRTRSISLPSIELHRTNKPEAYSPRLDPTLYSKLRNKKEKLNVSRSDIFQSDGKEKIASNSKQNNSTAVSLQKPELSKIDYTSLSHDFMNQSEPNNGRKAEIRTKANLSEKEEENQKMQISPNTSRNYLNKSNINYADVITHRSNGVLNKFNNPIYSPNEDC